MIEDRNGFKRIVPPPRFSRPFAEPALMSDAEIDALLQPGRAQRWKGDGRQYDRDTARLVERHLRETHR